MKKSSVKWAVLAAAMAFGLLLAACSNETTETVTKTGNIEDLPAVSDLKVQAGDGTQGYNKPVLVVSWKSANAGNYPAAYVLWVKGKDGTKKELILETNTPGLDLRDAEGLRVIDIDKRAYPIWDDNSDVTYFATVDSTTGFWDFGGTAAYTTLDGVTIPDPVRANPGASYYVLRNKSDPSGTGTATDTLIPLLRNSNATLTPKNSVVLDSGFDNTTNNGAAIRAIGASFDPPQNWAELSRDSSILPSDRAAAYPDLDAEISSILVPDAVPGYRIISPDRDNTDADQWYARIDLAAFIQALTQIADADSSHSVNPMDRNYTIDSTPDIGFTNRVYQDVDFEYEIGVQAVVNYRDSPDGIDCDDPRFFIDPGTVVYAPQTVRVFSLFSQEGYGVNNASTGNSTNHNIKVSNDYVANAQNGERFYKLGQLRLNNADSTTSTPDLTNNPNLGLRGLGVLVR